MKTTTFTISRTIDQGIIDQLEVEFDSLRHRIAHLSLGTSSTLTNMYTPLSPLNSDVEIIDIDAIEWDAFELGLASEPPTAELVASEPTVVLAFAAA